MSSLVISGDTSGTVTLQAPAVAGTTVLTLPATSGTVITTTSGTASSATTATTATNLAGGSNGTIPYQSASGTTQMLAVGTSGQVLQTNGAGAPSWVTPSAGAITLISTQTASGGTSVNWTGLTTYNKYQIIVENLYGTGGSILYLQLGYGAGPTYITSNYQYVNSTAYRGSAGSNGSSIYSSVTDSGAQIAGAAQSIGTNSFNGISGTIFITNMLATTGNSKASGTSLIGGDGFGNGSSAAMEIDSVGFSNSDTNVKTAIKLYTPYGTITGKFSLYGITS
jgi:hypothetical protein